LGRGPSPPLFFEVALAAGFYGDNDEFYGGTTLKQDDYVALKAYGTYTFRPGLWVSFAAGYGRGGATTVGGLVRNNDQSNDRVGVTCAYPLSPSQGLVSNLSSGYTQRAGPDFNTFGVGYQFSWGGT